MTEVSEWDIPRKVWGILASWGLAVLVLSGLFAAWIWTNQREQDRDMCALISVFQGGPEPVAGPSGDRARAVRDAISRYSARRGC